MAAIASHHIRLALFPLRLDAERTGFVDLSIYDRGRLERDDVINGPCIIEELTSTTFVQKGWQVRVDPMGNLIVRSLESER